MTAAIAVARNQMRILRNDPAFLVIMFLMPLALMPIMRDALGINQMFGNGKLFHRPRLCRRRPNWHLIEGIIHAKV